MFPSTTHRAGETHSTSGPMGMISSQAALFVAVPPIQGPRLRCDPRTHTNVDEMFRHRIRLSNEINHRSQLVVAQPDAWPARNNQHVDSDPGGPKLVECGVGTMDWGNVELASSWLETGSNALAKRCSVAP